MTYYEDLSPYEYWKTVWPLNPPERAEDYLNIGWLGRDREFPRGNCPAGFVDHLIDMASSPRNLTRGVHHCEFCDQKSPLRAESLKSGNVAHLGNGEIAIKTSSGLTYIAPTLIVHYVAEHNYLPPAGFIDAVMDHKEDHP
ncbi:DUF7919 family protein [Streptomyces sp. NPDC002523]